MFKNDFLASIAARNVLYVTGASEQPGHDHY
jgi:hypothetical protein